MFPNDEKDLVDAAAEHIESASVADGFESNAKPAPDQAEAGEPAVDATGSEPGIVGAAAEYIEDASIADGRVEGR